MDEPTIAVIELEKTDAGLGFNIVGGTDSPHIPGDGGIFVTKIKRNGPAYHDGRLNEGDKILSANGCSLAEVTHEQAVSIFRDCSGLVKLEVEPDAERTILQKPSIVRSTSSPKKLIASATSSNQTASPAEGVAKDSSCNQTASPAGGVAKDSPSPNPPTNDDDAPPPTSDSDVTVDDVPPPTPSRQLGSSPGDDWRRAYLLEATYVSVGLAALIGVGYLVYRKVWRH